MILLCLCCRVHPAALRLADPISKELQINSKCNRPEGLIHREEEKEKYFLYKLNVTECIQ